MAVGKTKDSGVDGLLVIDKAAGWTSHDVVARLRGAIGQRRSGHSGTLDPDATGVLLVGFGRVTKLLTFLTALPKMYTGEVVLGVTTSTLDGGGEITGRFVMDDVTIEDARRASVGFLGDIFQIPPMVSAVQIGGQRLHALARQGIEVERPPRPVRVDRFGVLGWAEQGVLSIEVECGSGTYIRSLAADLGAALGGGAHLRNLRRTRIGSFLADGAIAAEAANRETTLLSAAVALRDYPSVVVDDALAERVAVGRAFDPDLLGPGFRPGIVGLLNHQNDLLAVYEIQDDGKASPLVVLPAR